MKKSEFEKSIELVEKIYSTNGCRLEKNISIEEDEVVCEIEAYYNDRTPFDVMYINEEGNITTRSAYYQNAEEMKKSYRKVKRVSCNKVIDWYEKK